jgi:hypothetical protein
MVKYGEQGILAYSVYLTSALTELALNMRKSSHYSEFWRVFSRLLEVSTDTPQIASDMIYFLTAQRRECFGGQYIDCTVLGIWLSF